jgi:CHAT domain-containing protein
VLATQWSVIDGCAATMMDAFYERRLQHGDTLPAALRAAQARVRNMQRADIEAVTRSLHERFRAANRPLEAARVAAGAMLACRDAGRRDLAESWRAAALKDCAADRALSGLAAQVRGAATNAPSPAAACHPMALANWQSPLYWGAFQIYGRIH